MKNTMESKLIEEVEISDWGQIGDKKMNVVLILRMKDSNDIISFHSHQTHENKITRKA